MACLSVRKQSQANKREETLIRNAFSLFFSYSLYVCSPPPNLPPTTAAAITLLYLFFSVTKNDMVQELPKSISVAWVREKGSPG